MRLLRRRRAGEASAGVAAAERPLAGVDEVRVEIATLTEGNRAHPDPCAERRLVRARHLAGIRLLDAAPEHPEFAQPEFDALPDGDPLPELWPGDLTPGLLRAAVLRDGCALVRGLVPRAEAVRLAALIDWAYVERERVESGEGAGDGYYEEFEPDPRFQPPWRPWIKMGGGLLAADSPHVCFAMLEAFEAAGVPALVSTYLGEPGLISLHKSTLRRAEPSVSGAWHQDGFFMGAVRSLNLWLSLSRCGDESPGLDILPRRLDRYLATGTEGAELEWTIGEHEVTKAGAETCVIRPIFEPGDALLFDELFLHKTGSDPSMPRPRFAIENWFFGGSGFPGDYAPLAV
jgi:hypothetical protein